MKRMTVSRRFEWSRYLCPRGKPVFSDSEGYPAGARSEYRRIFQPNILSIEEALQAPCLVVLGEAGIGKSDVLKSICASACSSYGQTQVVYQNLALFTDAADLSRVLFDNPRFQSWLAECSTPFLILDSFDEAQAGIRNLVGLFQRRFGDLPCDKLRICIACRTAMWPETLTSVFEDKYRNAEMLICEVVGLSREDVNIAAEASGLDAQEFLSEIRNRVVQPLAINPSSLRLLLNLFSAGRGLPQSRVELYERGLTLLCVESRDRLDRGGAGPYSANQLIDAASRVAAFTILTGSSGVHAGSSDCPGGWIDISGFLGGQEGQGASRIEISDTVVRACLNTGLFTGYGPDLFGFAHKTYAEFFAARYLRLSGLTPDQRDSLLYTSEENLPRLVPQLHETAAWLASMDRSVFDRIITTEPEVLVGSDVSAHSKGGAEAIVQALLDRINAGCISYEQRRGLEPLLGRLKSPGLEELLGSVIADDNLSLDARESAIRIAQACDFRDLAMACASLALNPEAARRLRITASYAVCKLDQPQARAAIKRLAFSTPLEDPDDQLKGLALRACWPTHMNADELFNALQPPREPHLHGSYAGFLHDNDIIENVRNEHLPVGLRWAEQVPTHDFYCRSLATLVGKIAARAWDNMDAPGVLLGLARLVLAKLRDYTSPFCPERQFGAGSPPEDPFAKSISSQIDRRHRLVEAIVSLMQTPRQASELGFSEPALVYACDFAWLLKMACSNTADRAVFWAELAKCVSNFSCPEHIESWLAARDKSDVIAKTLDLPLLIELDSEDARKQREEYNKWQGIRARQPQREPLDPPPHERVRQRVLECLTENSAEFQQLLLEMTLEPASTHYDIPPYDIREAPGWQAASVEVRQQIVRAAARFVQTIPDDYRQFLRSEGEVPVSDLAAPIAFALLLNESPSLFYSITGEAWKGWSWNLIMRLAGSYCENDAKATILRTLFHHAPEESRDAVACLIHNERSESHPSFIIPDWEDLLDDELSGRLLGQLDPESYHPEAYSAVLCCLIRRGYTKALVLADKHLSSTLLPSAPGRELSVKIAQAVLISTGEALWPKVWSLIQSDTSWGREWIEQSLERWESVWDGFLGRLSDEHCGNLLAWLYRQYPPEGDRPHVGPHSPTKEEEARRFRDNVTEHLAARGTHESCAMIRQIRDNYPNRAWLSDLLLRAQSARRQKSWSPPSVAVMSRLVLNRQARYVAGPAALADVLRESLGRLQAKLHDELPARGDLWNEINSGGRSVWRPRDEEYLSDYIARHLRDDLRNRGVVANREVQIRRRFVDPVLGGEAGQRTDILVNSISLNPAEADPNGFSVIIEVKGSWNAEVAQAMRSQLMDRYLKSNSCRHGLYVVGWFASPGWDTTDRRRGACPWTSLHEAENILRSQALALTDAAEGISVGAVVVDCSLP